MRKHLLTLGSGYVSTSRGRCSLWPAFKPTKRGTLQRHKSVRSINWQSFCMSPLLPLCEGSLFDGLWTMRAVFVLPRSDGPGNLFHVSYKMQCTFCPRCCEIVTAPAGKYTGCLSRCQLFNMNASSASIKADSVCLSIVSTADLV